MSPLADGRYENSFSIFLKRGTAQEVNGVGLTALLWAAWNNTEEHNRTHKKDKQEYA